MVNMEPLHHALEATNCETEGEIIRQLIISFEQDSPYPRRMYESGEGGPFVSDLTFKALGEVLKSIDEKPEEVIKGKGKKALNFEGVQFAEQGESTTTTKGSKSPRFYRPSTRIRSRRKAALVARRRMRQRSHPAKLSDDPILISDDDVGVVVPPAAMNVEVPFAAVNVEVPPVPEPAPDVAIVDESDDVGVGSSNKRPKAGSYVYTDECHEAISDYLRVLSPKSLL